MPLPRTGRTRASRSAVVALGLAVGVGVASAQAGQDPTRPTRSASEGGVDDEVARVCESVAGLRGRPFGYSVPTRSMPCSLAAARLLEIAKLEGARCSSDVEKAVTALGFIEPEPTMPQPQVGTQRVRRDEESGPCGLAFYDQIRKEVVVVDGRSSPDERDEVLAHELSHALQDQLFDLRSRLRTITRTASGDHDAEELAANASVNEGEATAVELLYLWRRGDDRSWIQGVSLGDPLKDDLAVLGGAGLGLRFHDRSAAGMRSIEQGTHKAWLEQRRLGARCYYHALARFQYLVGASFVAEAYERGGWPMVDRLRIAPPTTTAELLHPARYFDRPAAPARVEASDLQKRGDFRLIYDNRFGELGSMVVTEQECPGWEGDRYRVLLRTTDDEPVIEARSVWKDASAATKFLTGVPRWLRSVKVGGATIDLLEQRGRAVAVASGLHQEELAVAREALWTGKDAVAAIGAKAGETSIVLLRHRGIDGAPDGELRLLASSDRSRVDEVLKAHLDSTRPGTLETDGRSFGLRSRPGGGFSWAEERSDGKFLVATGIDRAAIKALREAVIRIAPPDEPRIERDREP